MQKRSMTITCRYILIFSLLPILVRTQQEGYGADNYVNLQGNNNNANTNGPVQANQKSCKKQPSECHKKCNSSFEEEALSSKKLPTFTWLHDQASPDGVPLLAIKFPDGKPDDVVIMKKFDPIQRQPHERNANIDKCLFVGHMRDEPSAHVTLTGGCPFEDKLNIIMWSERSPMKGFSMSNGVVIPFTSVFGTKGISDIVVRPLGKKKPTVQTKTMKAYPYAKINVVINTDETFRSQFGAEADSIVSRVALLAKAWFRHPSLGSIIDFVFHSGVTISEKIEASEAHLLNVSQYNKEQYNTNVYMCFQNNLKGIVGIAKIGTICGETEERKAIVEYFEDDLRSSQILAHEVGHNLGMKHDFKYFPNNPRKDSFGCCCTNIGGVMDYKPEVSRWSSCSVEDYQKTNTECLDHSNS